MRLLFIDREYRKERKRMARILGPEEQRKRGVKLYEWNIFTKREGDKDTSSTKANK